MKKTETITEEQKIEELKHLYIAFTLKTFMGNPIAAVIEKVQYERLKLDLTAGSNTILPFRYGVN